MISLYLANRESYNEGEIVGEWIELPCYLNNCEDSIINDYHTDIEGLRIDKYDSIEELNIVADNYESLSLSEQRKVTSIIEWSCCSAKDAIESVNDFELKENISDNIEYGDYLVENKMGEIPEYIKKYIDIESLGRDTYENSNNGFYSSNGLIIKMD